MAIRVCESSYLPTPSACLPGHPDHRSRLRARLSHASENLPGRSETLRSHSEGLTSRPDDGARFREGRSRAPEGFPGRSANLPNRWLQIV